MGRSTKILPVDIYDRGGTVCVIGAGASGLLATKNLLEQGFGVDCYERETGVGGGWNWRHDRSPSFLGGHLTGSRPVSGIPDFPMPDSWPDFPDHRQMLSYLERYADHFGLRPQIWFGTEVAAVRETEDGRWDVTTRTTGGGTERTHRYAAVVVASGQHGEPVMPEYEGQARFVGEIVHASGLKDPAKLRGRRVLVVGAGNTGSALAVAAATHASACWHSHRRGYWYLPKYLFGRPVDQLQARLNALRLPLRARQWLLQRLLRVAVGDLRRFGLPAPDHRVYESPPLIGGEVLHAIGHGRVTPVPDVARFGDGEVELTDRQTINPDLVIMATGHRPRFDFLAPEVLALDEEQRPRLLMHVFSRRHPTLAVVGLGQPEWGELAVAHWQTIAIARWLRQRQAQPERAAAFWDRISKDPDRRWTGARPLHAPPADSPRRWFAVEHVRYLRALERAVAELERTK